MTNVTVLGAGAWGTAFGQVLADAGNNVTMWAIEPEIVEGIRDHHHNGVRLPSVKVLPSNMTATGDRAEAVANADIVIVAIAAQFARVALVEFKDLIPETALVASLMKGIERTTGKRMDEVVMETLDLPADRFAAISGPNLSKQIADREPAATVVACENLDNARKIDLHVPSRPPSALHGQSRNGLVAADRQMVPTGRHAARATPFGQGESHRGNLRGNPYLRPTPNRMAGRHGNARPAEMADEHEKRRGHDRA